MNKIGFENFRRFANCQPIEYNAITFLVGKNNSGKSTIVKALMLLSDYLKSDDIRTFTFSQTNIEDINIVTFGRAKCRRSSPSDDFIRFELQLNNCRIELIVSGKDDSTIVDVNLFKISDLDSGLNFIITPPSSSIVIESNEPTSEKDSLQDQSLLKELEARELILQQEVKLIKDKVSETFISSNQELGKLKEKIKHLKSSIRRNSIDQGNFSLSAHFEKVSLKDIFDEMMLHFTTEYELQYHDIQKGKKPKKIFESLKTFKDNKFKIQNIIDQLLHFKNQIATVYLGATLDKQSALFSIRDKKNALAQTIHEYKQLAISKGDDAEKFVLKWMSENEFAIGESFEIKMHAGEAYEVVVKSDGLKIPLADKGMGSIQAMLLILRLATIIHKNQKDKKVYTVIIEEPELNLHPALQSKLADLFLEVYESYKINFLIETHSEYILRRSQVLVAEKKLSVDSTENPFCVHYFPKEIDQPPYRLEYEENGRFNRNFDKGFFDEATNSTMTLLKLQMSK